ncbi:hypothetical protein [Collimonas pratensis]|uniref:Uncharacterized protein n=1 Tax=Collimonas pratensis TaxID=279113 RepID=A0ABM5ZB03_9BURK|nr:hypothetical protein [Collimonas pratensis]AMP16252.1 hypothetical protein CPter291_4019 [Collimonas pratensis]
MKKLLSVLALLLAIAPVAHAQNEPRRAEPGMGLEGHPDARNDRRPESFYDGKNRVNTHSVMRCKDGAMRKARADACRGHNGMRK